MWADATEQARLVRDGEVSALELVDAAIARLQSAPELNVLVHSDFEAARSAAAESAGEGPLAGVPFLLKALGEPQAGLPERMGSRALRDHVATETAWSVERYLAAGLIICGRTNTPEFGNHCATEPSLFGPTLNPWNLERSPGGSSGGSAAAVAAGLGAAAPPPPGPGARIAPRSPKPSLHPALLLRQLLQGTPSELQLLEGQPQADGRLVVALCHALKVAILQTTRESVYFITEGGDGANAKDAIAVCRMLRHRRRLAARRSLGVTIGRLLAGREVVAYAGAVLFAGRSRRQPGRRRWGRYRQRTERCPGLCSFGRRFRRELGLASQHRTDAAELCG